MNKLPILIKIELEKITHKRSVLWIVLAVLAIQIGAGFFEHSARLANDDLGTGFQVTTFSLKICLQLLALIVLAYSSMSLSEEIATGTAKIILVRDVKRRNFILGKFIALVCLSTTIVVICHLISLALGHFFGGLVAIKEGDYLLFSASELSQAFFGGMGLTVVAFFALIAFGCFISILIKGSGGAVATAIVIYFLMQILSQMNLFQKYFFTRYLLLPVDNMARLVEGIYVDWARYAWWTIGVSAASVLVFLALGIFIFNKRDVWD
jgi:ABC-type transport system involved in multi-copper enzyme maturation permease subunit